MKKIITTVLVIAVLGGTIGYVLTNNKKSNEAKQEAVAAGEGAVAVKAETVAKQAYSLDFTANGNLIAAQDLKLMSEANGRIISINVKEGDRVTKGQTLATIESTYASIDLANAQEALAKYKSDQKRLEASFKTGGVTSSQVDENNLAVKNAENMVSQAKKRLSDNTIKAPISGVINKKYIEVGSFVGAGASPLFDIVDVSQLKMKLNANEKQVVQLQIGTKVEVSVPVFPGEIFEGKVSFIAPKADQSLNYPIEVMLTNTKGSALKAGMYATAQFQFGEQLPIMAIPRTAFVGAIASNEVFVIEGGKAILKKVTSGLSFGEMVEVLDGLKEGEVVVTSGQINLVNGTAVEVVK